MEVTTDEEAQAVLLEGMEGAQYITIQRVDGESLGKGVPLLTLNGELISEGMVVDMINAGVGAEYNAATQYYETDDLLQHEMTEVTTVTEFSLIYILHLYLLKFLCLHNATYTTKSTVILLIHKI